MRRKSLSFEAPVETGSEYAKGVIQMNEIYPHCHIPNGISHRICAEAQTKNVL